MPEVFGKPGPRKTDAPRYVRDCPFARIQRGCASEFCKTNSGPVSRIHLTVARGTCGALVRTQHGETDEAKVDAEYLEVIAFRT
jgi:hypothetical protein